MVQAIGILSLDGGDLDAVIADHVERNPFLSRSALSTGAADVATLENHLSDAPSLRQYLDEQIGRAFSDPDEAALARALADELDDAGYVRAEPATLAARLAATEAMVERVLLRCREFEPAGLFARDLRDTLTIQLRARGDLDAPMVAVMHRLDLVARGDRVGLVRATGFSTEIVRERLARLRRCDPKPAAGWSPPALPTVLPVARLTVDANGRWRVRLAATAFPRVVVNEDYARTLGERHDAHAFVSNAMREARWLETALRRRARTIRLVLEEMVQRQSAFLLEGDAALRPLTMAEVARSIGMHETTVGRAVGGRSVVAPRGTLRMRDFFGSGVAAAEGPMAARAVARRIEQHVSAEAPDAILSDDRLAALLQADGIEIARRTVAKYRRELSIGSSSQRRREKGALV